MNICDGYFPMQKILKAYNQLYNYYEVQIRYRYF